MKFFAILFLLLLSYSGLSAPLPQTGILTTVNALKTFNEKLLLTNNEQEINSLLLEKAVLLDQLSRQLKQAVITELPSPVIGSELVLLESRVKLNTEKENPLAALRDKVKLEQYKSKQATIKYLEYLMESSKNFQRIDVIVKHSQRLLTKSQKLENKLVLPEIESEGKVFHDLKTNYQHFLKENNTYQDILKYISNNPRKIASTHWFQEFSLLSAISYVNNFDFIHFINYKLTPFKVDVGGITLSFVIFFLVYFSYPFIFKFTSWFIDKYLIDEGSEHHELIYHELRKPARALLLFFGINLGTYAFFYKTDYRASLEGFSFIIYSLLFIWLLFKLIDSLVLTQVHKLSNANIALRKELFNLAVQSAKGLVVIVFLAFGLNHFGISLTAIMSTLGVGGLAFALAAKDTLSNLFGGITILFDNVFKMGDWVKVDNVEGTVAEIGLRSTTIRTFDNALITIPNSLISVSSVRNWNRRAVGRRIKMYIGVTYESNMEDLRNAVEEIRKMLQEHPEIANPNQKHNFRRKNFKFSTREDTQGIKSTQLVFVDKYSDFSIDILIYCFTRTVNWEKWLEVKEDVMYKIAEILKQNNLQFAYPTQVRIHRSEVEDIG